MKYQPEDILIRYAVTEYGFRIEVIHGPTESGDLTTLYEQHHGNYRMHPTQIVHLGDDYVLSPADLESMVASELQKLHAKYQLPKNRAIRDVIWQDELRERFAGKILPPPQTHFP